MNKSDRIRKNISKSYRLIKSIFVFILPFILAQSTVAQNKEAIKKIESARIGLITQRLNLSPQQATQFWPLYNEFTHQRKAIKKEIRELNKQGEPGTITEKESKGLVNRQLELKQQELNLEKEYSDKLLDVISSQQMIALRKAENEFRQMLFDRLRQRRQQGKKTKPHRENKNTTPGKRNY